VEIVTPYSFNQCGECLIHPPPVDRNVTLFHYESPITSLITQLKFNRKLAPANAFGILLAERIREVYEQAQLDLPEYILPVPLHKKRLATRGYNQALEISRPIKRRLNLELEFRAVKRIKPTAPQTLVAAKDRQSNVKDAFVVNSSFRSQHVAIVDDVSTTFSTVSELARALRKSGVQRVDVWCVAKAGGG
jgi:ComF family protein